MHHEQSVMQVLGLAYEPDNGLPVAQCTYLEDFHESAPLHCVRADPVHLQLEREQGKLVPPSVLAIDPEHAADLVRDLNTHFGQECFFVGSNNRWYFTGEDSTGLNTVPTDYAAGRNVSLLLPRDEQTRRWRKISTEVQMFLHSHEINRQREASGLFPINSLWFWGGGRIDPGQSPAELRLFCDSAFTLGLSRLLGFTVYPTTEAFTALHAGGFTNLANRRQQVVVTDTRVVEAMVVQSSAQAETGHLESVLGAIDSQLLQPALALLRRGIARELVIDTCGSGTFRVDRWHLLKFWSKQPYQSAGPAVAGELPDSESPLT